ncbi:ABC transporter ATP-binding protein/permease [Amylibacter sp.]|nr:ABC transporter ATP-binding protein/permease [Amylibacter sp.]
MTDNTKPQHFKKIKVLLSSLPKKAQKKYILLLVFSVFVAGLELFVITAIAFMLNRDAGKELNNLFDLNEFFNPSIVYFSIIFLCLGRISLAFFTAYVNAFIGHQLSLSIYKNIFSWDYQSFEQENKNEIVADLMVKINQTVGRIIRPLTQLSISIVIILILIPVMIAKNPTEVLSLCILSFFIYFSFSKLINTKRGKISFIISKNTNRLSQQIRESLDGFILIKKQSLFSDFYRKYSTIDKELRIASDLSLALGIVPKYLLEFAVIALILLYAGTSNHGVLDYSFLLVALFRVAPLFQQIFLSLHSFRTFSQVLDDVLDRLVASVDMTEKTTLTEQELFTNMAMDERRTAVINVSQSNLVRRNGAVINFPEINIQLGGLNLLKGPSGSGKTTFFNCILSLYKFSEPPNVNLTVNDKSKKLISEFWDDLSFYISQETILFEAPLNENLLIKSSQDAEIKLDLILDVTGLSKFLNLDTPILENGKNFSGGQKQRICLARALVSKKPFIFIDEGINALDIHAQKQIIEKIKQNFPWITIIMICHDNHFDGVADIINNM